jgi:hypothetical protein
VLVSGAKLCACVWRGVCFQIAVDLQLPLMLSRQHQYQARLTLLCGACSVYAVRAVLCGVHEVCRVLAVF